MNLEGAEKEKMFDKYREFVRIPSISASRKSVGECASFLRDYMQTMGLHPEVMSTEGNPVVYGSYDAGASRTLLVYNHYDVQPVDPLDEWNDDPFSASAKDGRLYGRGSSDN